MAEEYFGQWLMDGAIAERVQSIADRSGIGDCPGDEDSLTAHNGSAEIITCASASVDSSVSDTCSTACMPGGVIDFSRVSAAPCSVRPGAPLPSLTISMSCHVMPWMPVPSALAQASL